jgi:hypothetical protein
MPSMILPMASRVRCRRPRPQTCHTGIRDCCRLQQLKGRVHPVEQNNTDDAEQQDGKGE